MAQGCRTGPAGYIGWRTGTTTLCNSQLFNIPLSGTMNLASGGDYDFRERNYRETSQIRQHFSTTPRLCQLIDRQSNETFIEARNYCVDYT
jgi:hypothetical protein